jgi:2-polyprenyl-6-methoxyphenol hydroxylase-like FAD-dependent oxidoreductase
MKDTTPTFDVCVRGRGAVGQALALSLARLGLRVALVAPPVASQAGRPGAPDVRTYALGARAVALLGQLRVWDALQAARPGAATRVTGMQIAGDAGGELAFSAWQQQVRELAWIVDAAALERELATALRFAPHVTLTEAPVSAALTAWCDGRDGAAHEALGIKVERVDYGHRAIAARLVCDRPHQGIARQWFRSPDVLALLPFDQDEQPGYGLVWSLPEAQADALMALGETDFEQALAEATQGPSPHSIPAAGSPGRLALAGPRAAWSLRLARATRWHGPGWVLLGDAAHVVHPLAGQGLNLGLADVDTLARVIAERQQREAWRPLGDERLLARYARERAAPTWLMGRFTDGLWQLFAQDNAALKELRNRGLSLVNRLPPLKRWLASQALQG